VFVLVKQEMMETIKLLPKYFLYKFLNDGFAMQWNKKNQNKAENFSKSFIRFSEDEYQFLIASLDPNIQDFSQAFDFLFVSKQNVWFCKNLTIPYVQISIENVEYSQLKSFLKDTLLTN
jgi:type I restriction enzyme M protein